jgi:hypothetical protein
MIRKINLSIIFIVFALLLLPNLKTKAQQKDSADYFYGKIISGKMYLNAADDSIKDLKNELFNEIAINPFKDKLVLVRPAIHMTPSDLKEPFILWLIDINTKHAIILVKSEDKDFGIVNPSWSPDGKWISFGSFSIGGHSPATTSQSWIVDSSGNRLQHINLPAPYGKFSNSVLRWEDKSNLIIHGIVMQIKKGKWHNIEAIFSYDCETKTIKLIK